MNNTKDINYICAFRDNNQLIIRDAYFAMKPPFMNYIAQRFTGISDYLDDVYQESFIRLQQNILYERLTEQTLTSTLQIYLQRIGYNVGMEYVRAGKEVAISRLQVHTTEDEDAENDGRPEILSNQADEEQDDSLQTEEREKLIRDGVMLMGKPCAPLLLLYYWDNKSMRDIAVEQGYSSEDVAKNQKSRCMKKLKTYIITTLKKHGYEYRTKK